MYSFPADTDPIRQGDIFRWLPKLDLLVGEKNLPILSETAGEGLREIDWLSVAQSSSTINSNINASVYAKSVTGIVINQDCDSIRNEQILFCEILPLKELFKDYKEDTPNDKKFIDWMSSYNKKNQKWFYLAENDRIGFVRKMSVNFESAFVVPREFINTYKDRLRIGHLDDEVAKPHFRERVSEYFRRYPYNEWYPLNQAELAVYESGKGLVDPKYPWQK